MKKKPVFAGTGSGLHCWQFSYAYALNFINRCFGSLFWLLGVPIGSLFQSLGVPNSFCDSGFDDYQLLITRENQLSCLVNRREVSTQHWWSAVKTLPQFQHFKVSARFSLCFSFSSASPVLFFLYCFPEFNFNLLLRELFKKLIRKKCVLKTNPPSSSSN